ncbi:MAG: hypothetical protein ABI395_10740 [Sphingobium sp.]
MSIIDNDDDESLTFAARCRSLGVATKNVRGNVSNLWFDDLYHYWRRSPKPIGGLTSHSTWFLLDMMARDAGMRTIYRGDHQRLGQGAMEHRLFGIHPPGSARMLRGATGSRWAAAVAMMVTAPDRTSADRQGNSTRHARKRMVGNDTIISWVIASPAAFTPLKLLGAVEP